MSMVNFFIQNFKIAKIYTFTNQCSFYCTRNIKPVKLAYKEYNAESNYGKPPIIILHGSLACKRNLHTMSSKIHSTANPKRKVFALDARNHGSSPHTPEHTFPHLSTDVIEFMDTQNIPVASLLGHSMGGRTSIFIALSHPDRIERLIVVDASIFPTKSLNSMLPLIEDLRQLDLPHHLPWKEGRTIVRTKLFEIFRNMWAVDFMLMNLKQNDDGRYRWCVNLDALYNNFEAYENFPLDNFENVQFNGPVLLMVGKESNFVPDSHVDNMRKYLPNMQVEYFDAGHTIHVAVPNEFLKSVLTFINKRD